MKIKPILKDLQVVLEAEVEKFKKLGKKAKEMSLKLSKTTKLNKKIIDDIGLLKVYREMTAVVRGLGVAVYIVRNLHPELAPLFDELLLANWENRIEEESKKLASTPTVSSSEV